jgi:ketopantoate reductase
MVKTAERAFVIGMGEVGRRLAGALSDAGWDVLPVTRDRGWTEAADENDTAPRVVAVREEELGAALERLPRALLPRVVLVQNGFLEAVHGPLDSVTRGLIYFTSKGDFFEVLCASPFHGPLAAGLVAALRAGRIPCSEVAERDAYLRAMIVKGVWNVVVGLPLAVHGVDLATYLHRHRDELEALAAESTAAAGAEYGVDISGAVAVRKILETTSALGWVKGGAKALQWRNGAIARFGRRHGVPTPVNDRLLTAVDWNPDREHSGFSANS